MDTSSWREISELLRRYRLSYPLELARRNRPLWRMGVDPGNLERVAFGDDRRLRLRVRRWATKHGVALVRPARQGV